MSHEIVSPLPGLFYRKPGPGKDNFVEVGDAVEAGQTIGLIEIMKQFTEVRSEVAGTVAEFRIDDNGMVNPGDVVAVIE
ncbi:acetyl-CoA carboxylase [Leucobacter sp. M11]|uniref:acetyl-CoA carboxylase n=1 Tax=Leucobacter sp. M11 TaxID=2993565 RepID=UPI002D80D1A5|nr:acetyl-CoA carboxylase [Leucobacter sp. M11]MEB4614996.1 acetyl-CoA carboxylase [Leucobacter sp. M11]